MKNITIFISTCLLLTIGYAAIAQTRYLSLEEVIQIAKTQSPDALKAKHRFLGKYWRYNSYKRTKLPALSFEGTLPSFSRDFKRVTNPQDGSESYVAQRFMSYEGNLKLNQAVALTGGNIFLQSGLRHLINYKDHGRSSGFLSTPVNIGVSQPLFQFNQYKWDKKLEPLAFQIAKKSYLQEVEQISITAVNYFFNLMIAQVEYKIAEINMRNYDTLNKVAQGRFNLGRIGEDEVLQMQLSKLKAETALEANAMALEDAAFRLKSYLRLKEDEDIELIVPHMDKMSIVEPDLALRKAETNSAEILGFDQRLLEADKEVNKARLQTGFQANLSMVYGLTRSASELVEVYQHPEDQQRFSLGLQVPILDWGYRKGRIKLAESNQDLVKTSVEQERTDFKQNVYLRVAEYNNQQRQVLIAAKSDTIAKRSYAISKNRYLIGKIGVTDLNIAQKENDQAKVAFIRALQTYWTNYFRLRKTTLYDFIDKKDIEVDYNDIIEN